MESGSPPIPFLVPIDRMASVETIELNCAPVDSLSVLNALLVYEDTETGLRGQRALASVQSGGQFESAFEVKLWRADLLNAIWLREQAAIDAARSDIIMLSFHESRVWPTAVREWLSAWQELKSWRPSALCVLLDVAPEPTGVITAYVQALAEAAGADLFWGFCSGNLANPGAIEPRVLRESASGLPLKARSVAHPAGRYSRWGLNE